MTTFIAVVIAVQAACALCLLYCSWPLFALRKIPVGAPDFWGRLAKFDRRFTTYRVVLIGVVSFVIVLTGLLIARG